MKILLVMDVQPRIVDRLHDKNLYLTGVRKAVSAAHKNRIPVIYVVVGFRSGLPEVSENNKSFAAIKETGNDTFIDPRPIINPIKSDVVVVKRRVSAFSGSDLEVILRAQNLKHLVLSGVSTSGVVLSTLREAADKDFQITVLSDLCADFDDDTHSLLLEKIFPRQASVVTSKHWIDSLKTKK